MSRAGDVSRETNDRLQTYAELLKKWNRKINLVSPSTIAEMETRHFVDSTQLFEHAPNTFDTWVDLGSGGGFPGLVIAIMLAQIRDDPVVTLIESDKRKCEFLRTVLRATGVKANVVSERIERVDPLRADVVSARALASLTVLLQYCERHLAPNGTALFLKGARWEEEAAEARTQWRFDLQAVTSKTEAQANILKITGLSRV